MKKIIIFNAFVITALVAAPSILAQGSDITTTTEFQNLINFIKGATNALVALAATISGGFFTWGGYGYITSAGNPEGLEKSKKTIMYSAIGLSITTGAFVITKIVTQLAESNFSN